MIQTTEDLNRTAPYCQDADSTFVYAEEDECTVMVMMKLIRQQVIAWIRLLYIDHHM
jgi:hypothetical protein